MRATEHKIKELRESVDRDVLSFLYDDAFALKLVNEINIKKLHKNIIQHTFDTTLAKAFDVVTSASQRGIHEMRDIHRDLATASLKEYRKRIPALTLLQDNLEASIDCAIEKARKISHIDEEQAVITDAMYDEELALEKSLREQLMARIEAQQNDNTVTIGTNRVTIVNAPTNHGVAMQ
jgi:hypothetical protein